MKNAALILICSSAFLYACGGPNDAGSAKDAAKESANEPPNEPAKEPASDVVVSGGAENVAQSSEQGKSVYKSKCYTCHDAGIAGAPKLGDTAAWTARIAQGNDVLLQHAIKGFKGDKGYMPPKGGFMSLSDEEISIAVEYMVSQSQ